MRLVAIATRSLLQLVPHTQSRAMASSAAPARGAGEAPADAAAAMTSSQSTAKPAAASTSGDAKVKRQRLLAPLPAGAPAQQPRGGGGSKGGKGGGTAYKEPGPGQVALPGGGRLLYRTDLISRATAASFFQQLRDELPWEQRRWVGQAAGRAGALARCARQTVLMAGGKLPHPVPCVASAAASLSVQLQIRVKQGRRRTAC